VTKMLKIVVCVSSSFFSESPVSVKLTDGKIATGTKGPVIEAVNYSDRCALEEAGMRRCRSYSGNGRPA